MFAVIYLPDFFLQAALRPKPELTARPVALIDPNASPAAIVQLTQSARDAGVTEGMTATQALARSAKLLLKSRSLPQERSAADCLVNCALSFSPYVEATGEGMVTLDLQGFPQIDYAALGQKIVSRLLLLNLASQVGVAENPLLAAQAARCARPFRLVENSKEFLAELSIESIEPSAEILTILKSWGIQSLGAFLALPKESLALRLGPEALELFERASADRSRPLRRVHPLETFEEEIEFENEIQTTQPLLLLLRQFLEQIAARLEMLCLVVEELRLRLTFSDRTKYEQVFKIPAPTRQIDTLFRILQTHLDSFQAEHPVTGLGLAAKPGRPANQQFDLFEGALRDPNRFSETLARLSALVGSDRVGTPVVEPTHRPDAFRLQSISFLPSDRLPASFQEPMAAVQGLCLRRFRPPLPMHLESCPGGAVLFHSSRFRERILKVRGPWPSSGDWWDKLQWCRVEWDIQSEVGTLFRVFQEGGFWFLEGVYD